MGASCPAASRPDCSPVARSPPSRRLRRAPHRVPSASPPRYRPRAPLWADRPSRAPRTRPRGSAAQPGGPAPGGIDREAQRIGKTFERIETDRGFDPSSISTIAIGAPAEPRRWRRLLDRGGRARAPLPRSASGGRPAKAAVRGRHPTARSSIRSPSPLPDPRRLRHPRGGSGCLGDGIIGLCRGSVTSFVGAARHLVAPAPSPSGAVPAGLASTAAPSARGGRRARFGHHSAGSSPKAPRLGRATSGTAGHLGIGRDRLRPCEGRLRRSRRCRVEAVGASIGGFRPGSRPAPSQRHPPTAPFLRTAAPGFGCAAGSTRIAPVRGFRSSGPGIHLRGRAGSGRVAPAAGLRSSRD